jgi:hypothetical protein
MLDIKSELLLFVNAFSSSNIFNSDDIRCKNFSFNSIVSNEGFQFSSLKFDLSIHPEFYSFFHLKFSGRLQHFDKWFIFQGSFIRHIKLGFITQNNLDSFFSI